MVFKGSGRGPKLSHVAIAALLTLAQGCAVLTREAPPPTASPGSDGGTSCAGDISPVVDLSIGALSALYAAGGLVLGVTAIGSHEAVLRPGGAPSNDLSGAILLSSAAAALLIGASFTASSVWGFQHPCGGSGH
jgi:hypothetical protein